jgi:hypothetical protein
MKLTAHFLLLQLCLLFLPLCTSATNTHIFIADTLPDKNLHHHKQALAADTRQAVGFFAKRGFENEAYRISFPPELLGALDTLANTQFAALAETFKASLNRCAAKLVEYIAPDFIKTAKHFSAADTTGNGIDYAAFVNQFKQYSQEHLTATAFAYEQHLLETTGTLSAYRKLAGAYNGLFAVHNKLNFVLEGFLSSIAVDAIFKFLAVKARGKQPVSY